jgi:PAS domain-containing protein
MRSWSIRRKSFAIPILAAVLFTGATLGVLESQIWLILGLGAALLVTMVAACHFAYATPVLEGSERAAQSRSSSEFLKFAQAAGGFGVFDLDLVTGQLSGTPLFFELLDIRSNAALVTYDEWLATVHPEDSEGLRHTLNAAIDTGGTFQTEYRSLLLDSSTRWLAVRGRMVEDENGLVARAIGTIADITVRKQLEESLRYATESLNVAQAVAGVATMDLDLGQKRYIASANFQTILGVPDTTKLDDLNGHLAAVHPDDLEMIRRAPFETTAENRPRRQAQPHHRIAGRRDPFEARRGSCGFARKTPGAHHARHPRRRLGT